MILDQFPMSQLSQYSGSKSSSSTEKLIKRLHLYVNETVDEDLFCGCCTEIVIDPLECEGCNTLFCKKCVFHRKRYDDHCPINCPSQFNQWSLLNPHPKYKKLLNELTFKCDCSCNETYSYQKFLEHHNLLQGNYNTYFKHELFYYYENEDSNFKLFPAYLVKQFRKNLAIGILKQICYLQNQIIFVNLESNYYQTLNLNKQTSIIHLDYSKYKNLQACWVAKGDSQHDWWVYEPKISKELEKHYQDKKKSNQTFIMDINNVLVNINYNQMYQAVMETKRKLIRIPI